MITTICGPPVQYHHFSRFLTAFTINSNTDSQDRHKFDDDVPSQNRHKFDAPSQNRHKFDTPSQNRHKFDAPSQNQHKSDAPSQNRHKSDAPSQSRHKSDAPYQNHAIGCYALAIGRLLPTSAKREREKGEVYLRAYTYSQGKGIFRSN
eukprot:COSAG02_NODE_7720_length_2875_cov_209.079251_2_plen_149_part_00